mmetsp:Transcript_53237/g.77770  ORF Transcript_53237/g.77770 Transcript_53237/m.77770 type:complete len:208 (+) Transcript_53237:19-642(+)
MESIVKLFAGTFAFGGAAVASCLAVVAAHVRKLPSIPEGSLLSSRLQECEHVDAFVTSVPLHQLKFPVDDMQHPRNSIIHFSRAFFCSPAFRVERKILSLALDEHNQDMSDEMIQKMDFEVGQKVALFTVTSQSQYEVLFDWGHGITWLGVGAAENSLSGDRLPTVNLYLGSSITKWPPFSKALLPSHYLYSMVLLGSARYQMMKSH